MTQITLLLVVAIKATFHSMYCHPKYKGTPLQVVFGLSRVQINAIRIIAGLTVVNLSVGMIFQMRLHFNK